MDLIKEASGTRFCGTDKRNIGLTLDCGQAFRWEAIGENTYRGIAFGRELTLRDEPEGLLFLNTDPAEIEERMKEYKRRRSASQPLEFPSAGSVFKRPVNDFAGRLIEASGLKGIRVGGAEVSEKHAGFIVNRGGATASDVKSLIELIKERVLKDHGVLLECEIRFLDF